MNSLPTIAPFVKTNLSDIVNPVPISIPLKHNILDKSFEPPGFEPETSSAEFHFPHTDPRVEEVLNNGGFLWIGYSKDRGEIYRYVRTGREGQPLSGKEAKTPPVYTLSVWGILPMRCTCQDFRCRDGRQCKHMTALLVWLAPARSTIAASQGGQN